MPINKYEVYNKIDVYQGLFSDLDKTINLIKNSETSDASIIGPWEDWYVFGKIVRMEIPERSNNMHESHKEEYEMYNELCSIFNTALNDYIDSHGYRELIDSMDWKSTYPAICKYNTDATIGNDMVMTYHTDYQNELEGAPGWKFGFTVTMYLNDDYLGGEVDFYTEGKLIALKPKAGDVTVFPSGSPDIDPSNRYMHGVKTVKGNPKYFVRMHYQYWKDADQEYTDGLNMFGEELWLKMREEKFTDIRAKFGKDNNPNQFTPRLK